MQCEIEHKKSIRIQNVEALEYHTDAPNFQIVQE